MYAPDVTLPMEQELTKIGFKALRTEEEVASKIDSSGTVLAVINSVCGCAAGAARPGVAIALAQATKQPNRLVTSFAGVDREAVDAIRARTAPFPASSPSMALFKDGQLLQFIGREQIEGQGVDLIAENLKNILEKHF